MEQKLTRATKKFVYGFFMCVLQTHIQCMYVCECVCICVCVK